MGLRLALLLATASWCAAQDRILWKDPGDVARVDLAGANAEAPRPPFRFLKEQLGGSSPKVLVRDGHGVEWRVKGGLEVRSETFSTRLVSALGYYAHPTWFVAQGK